MDEQRQDDQLEPTYSSSVPIQDLTMKTSRKRWTIETVERERHGDPCLQRNMMMMMMMNVKSQYLKLFKCVQRNEL